MEWRLSSIWSVTSQCQHIAGSNPLWAPHPGRRPFQNPTFLLALAIIDVGAFTPIHPGSGVAPNARSLSIGCEGCSSPWVRLTYLDAWLVSFFRMFSALKRYLTLSGCASFGSSPWVHTEVGHAPRCSFTSRRDPCGPGGVASAPTLLGPCGWHGWSGVSINPVRPLFWWSIRRCGLGAPEWM